MASSDAPVKIYGIARSRAWRNYWAAEEAGVAYEMVETNWSDGGTKKAEFLAINPSGAVPALTDGSFAMSESLAINLYVARKGKGIYPASPQDEAKTWQWTLLAAIDLEKPLAMYVTNALAGPADKRDAAKAAEAWKQLEKPLGVLDAALKGRDYLLGSGFSIADLNVACICYNAWFNKADFSRWPALKSWLDRCLTRPACAKIRKLREG